MICNAIQAIARIVLQGEFMALQRVKIPPADREASLAKRDPWAKLMTAAVMQACSDVHDPDPIRAIDALSWLIEGDGPDYLGALGLPGDPDLILRSVTHARAKRLSSPTTAGAEAAEPAANRRLPARAAARTGSGRENSGRTSKT